MLASYYLPTYEFAIATLIVAMATPWFAINLRRNAWRFSSRTIFLLIGALSVWLLFLAKYARAWMALPSQMGTDEPSYRRIQAVLLELGWGGLICVMISVVCAIAYNAHQNEDSHYEGGSNRASGTSLSQATKPRDSRI